MRSLRVFLLIFLGIQASFSANLLDIYKKGVVTLVPDLEYGKNTEWEKLLYGQINSFAIARDGSLFVTTLRQDRIFKFDKDGHLVKAFGQKGQGPGDLQDPRDLSILDDQYLVVREASGGRMSFFDLEGGFAKIVQASGNVMNCVSLRNDRIALLTSSFAEEKEGLFRSYRVHIRNVSTGSDFEVDQFRLLYNNDADFIRGNYPSLYGWVFISPMEDGNKLLVGFSNDSKIKIYSGEGKSLGSFDLSHLAHKKIDRNMKNLFFKDAEERINQQIRYRAQSLELLKKAKEDDVLPEYAPYYYDVRADPEGNILVFKFFLFEKKDKACFQVYSSRGEFICEAKVDAGEYEPVGQVLLHRGYAFGPFRKKGGDEGFSFFRMMIR